MSPQDMPKLAGLIARALIGNDAPAAIATDVTDFRRSFTGLHFVR
jgi:glycine hydroxymethyltransferase